MARQLPIPDEEAKLKPVPNERKIHDLLDCPIACAMSSGVCVCVCMCVCMYVYVCTCVCVSEWLCVCLRRRSRSYQRWPAV